MTTAFAFLEVVLWFVAVTWTQGRLDKAILDEGYTPFSVDLTGGLRWRGGGPRVRWWRRVHLLVFAFPAIRMVIAIVIRHLR